MKKYSAKIYSNKLYACRSKKYLAKYLSEPKKELYVTVKELRNIDRHFFCKGKEFYQSKITSEKFKEKPLDYNPKKYRKFTDANTKHKKVLKRINYYLSRIELPNYYFSKPDSCYKFNARFHRGNTKFILMDISNFYPNCRFSFVKDFCLRDDGLNMKKNIKSTLGEDKTETDVADVFARLVTVPKNKSKNDRIIPQGYPTSTLISFFSYKKMFDEIYAFASDNNCKFSVYVDDLTFSFDKETIDSEKFINEIKAILIKYGHKASERKIKYIDIQKKKANAKTGSIYTETPIITGIFLKRYLIKASPKIHKKMNRYFNKVNSAGPPQNSKDYIKNWQNFNSLVGLYHTVNFIEPKTKKDRQLILKLINLKSKDYLQSISISRIKQLKWEDKLFDTYRSGRLSLFLKKNKDKLLNYKVNKESGI